MDPETWFAQGERLRVDLETGAFEVFCRVAGSGPWLTFLHGFPTSSWDWAQVASSLESDFRVLCFDFLGFGDSDKPRDHRYAILDQADLTEAIWRRYEVDGTGVVAHDYGATVALELLARQAELTLATRISKLMLLNAALYADLARPLPVQRLLAKPILGALLARTMSERAFGRGLSSVFSASHPIAGPEVRQHWEILRRRGSSVPVAPRLARYLVERRTHAARWEGALERADVPRIFVWGMADPRSGSQIAERIRRRLPTMPVKPLAEVGHYPQLEVPDRVIQEVREAFPAR